MKTYQQKTKHLGFSLVEMAVVLVILGFVLGALLLPLQAQRTVAFQTKTEDTLELAKKSLIGFAQANGRLPCPAILTSNGIEAPLGGGICNTAAGFLPAATLGVQPVDTEGFAVDAWNNRIRYAVTAVTTNAGKPDFTTVSQIDAVGIQALAPDLRVCSDAASCTSSFLIDSAVAVIFSTGENFGITEGADETANLSATTTFYSRTPTADGATEGEFDDIVIWISPYPLYNAMIEAGQLH